MIDYRTTTYKHDPFAHAYAVGNRVMLDGAMRVPVVVRTRDAADDVSVAFTVPLRDDQPAMPARTPHHALPVPAHLSLRDALCLPAQWPRIYSALVQRLNVKPRDAVLIHDAHTPVGMLACLLVISLDADVLAVCDNASHARRAIAMGAIEATTSGPAWPELIREHGGVDVVLDPAGGYNAGASTLCARRHARIGVMDGVSPLRIDDVQWQRVFGKQIALIPADWSPLRDAALVHEAAAAFDAITRTDAWTRYVSLRDNPLLPEDGDASPLDEPHWISIET